MAYEMALALVQGLHTQASTLARGIVRALEDGHVTPWEGMAMGMQGMTFATALMTVLTQVDAATRAEVLYVLEHGQMTLPEGA